MENKAEDEIGHTICIPQNSVYLHGGELKFVFNLPGNQSKEEVMVRDKSHLNRVTSLFFRRNPSCLHTKSGKDGPHTYERRMMF